MSSQAIEAPVWDNHNWQPLNELRENVSTDVCVVGLGASGLSCIEAFTARGHSVVGIDAADAGGGAAGRNGGFLLAGLAAFHHDAVARHGREFTDSLYRDTMHELDRIFADMAHVARRTGSLRIATSAEEEADCERQLQSMRESGIPVEPYEGAEGSGLLIPTDGVFNPLMRCRVLARRCMEAGARLAGNTPALAIQPGEVRAPHATVSCDRIVVAVDGRLESLLPQLEGEVRTARLQMLATEPLKKRLGNRAVYLRYGYEYWQQLPDGRLALGGFRDRGGNGEWTNDPAPGGVVQQELERYLREQMQVDERITHRWAASVAFTRSGLPWNGEVHPRIWAVGGYSGTGNVMGTMLARRIWE